MSNNDSQPIVSPLKIQSRLSLKRTSFQASSPDDEQASSSGSSSVVPLSSRTKLCELTETTVQNKYVFTYTLTASFLNAVISYAFIV